MEGEGGAPYSWKHGMLPDLLCKVKFSLDSIQDWVSVVLRYTEPPWPLRLAFILAPPVSLWQVISTVPLVCSGPFPAWLQKCGSKPLA